MEIEPLRKILDRSDWEMDELSELSRTSETMENKNWMVMSDEERLGAADKTPMQMLGYREARLYVLGKMIVKAKESAKKIGILKVGKNGY